MRTITINRSEIKRDVCNVSVVKQRPHGESVTMFYLPNENHLEMILNPLTGVYEFPGFQKQQQNVNIIQGVI